MGPVGPPPRAPPPPQAETHPLSPLGATEALRCPQSWGLGGRRG